MDAKKRNFYLIYFAFMLVFLIFIVEVASHFVLKHKDFNGSHHNSPRHLFHPYRSHALNPDYFRPTDSAGAQLHSPDGFRSDYAFSKEKKPDTFRIIMMGGSTLYGFGAEAPYDNVSTLQNDETISWYLQEKLNQQLQDAGEKVEVEIINAGVAAYQTFHHLVYFNESLYEYDADLLVFLDGNNDFYFDKQFNNWRNFSLGTALVTNHWNKRDLWFTNLTFVRFMARYSRFFLVAEKYLQQSWQGTPIDSGDRAASESGSTNASVDAATTESIFDSIVLKSYIQIAALSEMFDFEMMVFLQPQVVFENEENLSDADKQIKKITLTYDENHENKTAIRPELAALFEKKDIPFHDIGEIASVANKDKQLYIDYCHLSPDGSDQVAAKMAPQIYDTLLNRIAQQRASSN